MRIIMAADRPDQTQGGAVIGLENDTRLQAPVASRYAATTPALLRWFKLYNWGKPYEKKVRPFGFPPIPPSGEDGANRLSGRSRAGMAAEVQARSGPDCTV